MRYRDYDSSFNDWVENPNASFSFVHSYTVGKKSSKERGRKLKKKKIKTDLKLRPVLKEK